MSVDSSRYRLRDGYQKLQAAWEETLRNWHDQVRREFDQKYISPMGPRVAAALSAMDQLGQILHRARQECGEEGIP